MNNHNTSNAPGEVAGTARIISELEFNNYTQQWLIKINQLTAGLKAAEKTDTADFKAFFLKKDDDIRQDHDVPEQRLLKVYFDCEAVHHIISSVGIKTIKARFAIVDDYLLNGIVTPTFTIILYGVDTLGNRCSAYSIGQPQYDYNYVVEKNAPGDISQSISDNLAQRWLKNWKQAEIDTTLFDTNYGYLNGYNYLMADFMNSLYPPGTTRENNGVFVLLAAHDYISYTPGSEHAEVMTFGLVLAGVNMPKSRQNSPGDFEGAVDIFYDLSLPSPPNYQTA